MNAIFQHKIIEFEFEVIYVYDGNGWLSASKVL